MPYVDGLLATDERIIRRERQHWLWPVQEGVRGLLVLVAGVALFAVAWVLGPNGAAGTVGGVLAWFALPVLIIGLAWLGWAILRWQNEEYAITTRRVVQAGGVFNKHEADSSLEMINDAQITVPLIGRILGFGDLEVMTASEAGIDRFRLLRDPVGFKRAMMDAKRDLAYDHARPRMPAPPIRSDGTTAPPPQRTDVETAPVAAAPVAAAPVAAAPVAATPPAVAAVVAATPAAGADAAAEERPAGGSPEEVTRTLGALADLRDRGAISPEEYEAKKRELLARL